MKLLDSVDLFDQKLELGTPSHLKLGVGGSS